MSKGVREAPSKALIGELAAQSGDRPEQAFGGYSPPPRVHRPHNHQYHPFHDLDGLSVRHWSLGTIISWLRRHEGRMPNQDASSCNSMLAAVQASRAPTTTLRGMHVFRPTTGDADIRGAHGRFGGWPGFQAQRQQLCAHLRAVRGAGVPRMGPRHSRESCTPCLISNRAATVQQPLSCCLRRSRYIAGRRARWSPTVSVLSAGDSAADSQMTAVAS